LDVQRLEPLSASSRLPSAVRRPSAPGRLASRGAATTPGLRWLIRRLSRRCFGRRRRPLSPRGGGRNRRRQGFGAGLQGELKIDRLIAGRHAKCQIAISLCEPGEFGRHVIGGARRKEDGVPAVEIGRRRCLESVADVNDDGHAREGSVAACHPAVYPAPRGRLAARRRLGLRSLGSSRHSENRCHAAREHQAWI
jgi:hypothetical protein